MAPDRRGDSAAHWHRRAARPGVPLPLRRSCGRDERHRLLVLRQVRAEGRPHPAGGAGHDARARGDGAGPDAARSSARATAVHDPVGAAEPVRHRRNPQHAPVAVTEGLLQHLPPDQVKSLLAHEFGHIKNRATSSSRRSPRWWQGRSRRSRRSTPSTHWHGRVWRPSSRRIRRLPGAHAGCGRSTMTWPSPSPHRVVA